MSQLHFDTLQLHAGQEIDETTRSRAVPIYQTTSFTFKDSAHGANLFALKEFGNIYTRLNNPTNDVFEKRIAALEGGVSALATSSGQSAQFIALNNILEAGDNFVSTSFLYGGTYNQFKNAFKRLGVEARFANSDKPEDFEALIDDQTKALYLETMGNPGFNIPDFDALASLAKKYDLPLVVDNTFGAGGYLFRPIEHGAAVVVYSLTKYIGGHGTVVGGALVDGGNFDWTADPKRQPLFNEPDASYGGVVWGKAVPELTGANVSFVVRARVTLLRDLGSALAPDNAFGIIQGLETVALRMKQHCSNAQKVVEYLAKHESVARVIYPNKYDGEIGERAKKYLKGGNGALVGIELKGGIEAGKKFIEALKMFYHVANIGDARSLAIHPATTTHSQLNEKELLASGVTPVYVRLAIGIEHIDDIIEDLDQALSRTSKNVEDINKAKAVG